MIPILATRQSCSTGDPVALQRWIAVAAASAAISYGLSRRSAPGFLLAVAAAPLAYSGLTAWPRTRTNGRLRADDTRVALGGARGIHVRESIRVERPVDEVYRYWRQLDNLPKAMSHLEQVTDLGNNRSHWAIAGPAGVRFEWDAEIINDVANKVIGWRSLPHADVVSAGSVNFSPVRGGRSTQVDIHLQYSTPTGRVAAILAAALGHYPAGTIREELRRLKSLLEAGEVPRATAENTSGAGR